MKFKVFQLKSSLGKNHWEESIAAPIEAENEKQALKDAEWIFGGIVTVEKVDESKERKWIKY